MADLPLDPELPTNNEGHAEVPRRSLNPDPEVRQPSTWAPTSDEERRIFRVWKGFTLAERKKKGGKRVLASISDFMNLKRSDPKEQALANSLIKRCDLGYAQALSKMSIAYLLLDDTALQEAVGRDGLEERQE
ncbi:uncharacterized protein FTOL_13650 [Fusarium torulosum]|uniref:Uncharacterized protein n=1 Tax=Fusarium torulosum TaxID=33205 RepID=A0AAE8SQF0_9HYPO|nr:uncharacterized protein FTOL_13650 [Fusarium torulosum]